MCALVRGLGFRRTRCCCCGGCSRCQERHLLPGCSMAAGCAVIEIDYMHCVDGVCVAGSTRTCCCWGWLLVSSFVLVSFSLSRLSLFLTLKRLVLWVLACVQVYTCVLPVKVCLVHSTLIRVVPVHANTAPNMSRMLPTSNPQALNHNCVQTPQSLDHQQAALARCCSQLNALLVQERLQLHRCKARWRLPLLSTAQDGCLTHPQACT